MKKCSSNWTPEKNKANISFVAHENEFQKECGPKWNQLWFVFQILMAVFHQRQFCFSLILTIFETRFDAQKRNVGVFSQAFKWFMYIKIFFFTLFAKIETWIRQCFCKSGAKMPTSARNDALNAQITWIFFFFKTWPMFIGHKDNAKASKMFHKLTVLYVIVYDYLFAFMANSPF